jgi:hypothetical protein
MNLQIKVTDNSGTIVIKNDSTHFKEKSDVYLESAYIYCSNSFAINSPCYVYLDIGLKRINNFNNESTFIFYPNSAASNVLKIDNRLYLGNKINDGLSEIEYKIYNSAFSLLTGNITMVLHLTFV